MNLRVPLIIALLMPCAAAAADAITSLQPEEATPEDTSMLASLGPYADLFRQVQEKLRAQGFDAGPVNGDFGTKTQAALAQFQRARDLPVSGMLDEATRAALDIE